MSNLLLESSNYRVSVSHSLDLNDVEGFLRGEKSELLSQHPDVCHYFTVNFKTPVTIDKIKILADNQLSPNTKLEYFAVFGHVSNQKSTHLLINEGQPIPQNGEYQLSLREKCFALKFVKTYPNDPFQNELKLSKFEIIGSCEEGTDDDESGKRRWLFKAMESEGILDRIRTSTNSPNKGIMSDLVIRRSNDGKFLCFTASNPQLTIELSEPVVCHKVEMKWPDQSWTDMPQMIKITAIVENGKEIVVLDHHQPVARSTSPRYFSLTPVKARGFRVNFGDGNVQFALEYIDFLVDMVGDIYNFSERRNEEMKRRVYSQEGYFTTPLSVFCSDGILSNVGHTKRQMYGSTRYILNENVEMVPQFIAINGDMCDSSTINVWGVARNGTRVCYAQDYDIRRQYIKVDNPMWIKEIEILGPIGFANAEIFGNVRSIVNPAPESENGGLTFKYGYNVNRGFFWYYNENEKWVIRKPYKVYDEVPTYIEERDDSSYSDVILQGAKFTLLHMFNKTMKPIEVLTVNGVWQTIAFDAYFISLDSPIPIMALRLPNGVQLSDIEIFGHSVKKSVDMACEFGMEMYIPDDLIGTGTQMTINHILGPLNLVSYESTDSIRLDNSIPRIRLESDEHQLIVNYKAAVNPVRIHLQGSSAWNGMFIASIEGTVEMDDNWEPICANILNARADIAVDKYYRRLRIKICIPNEIPVGENLSPRIYGYVRPVDDYDIKLVDSDTYVYETLSPKKGFITTYNDIATNKIDRTQTEVWFDGLNVSPERFFLFNSPVGLKISIIDVDGAMSELLSLDEDEDVPQCMTVNVKRSGVYAKKIIFNKPVKFWDFTGKIKMTRADNLIMTPDPVKVVPYTMNFMNGILGSLLYKGKLHEPVGLTGANVFGADISTSEGYIGDTITANFGLGEVLLSHICISGPVDGMEIYGKTGTHLHLLPVDLQSVHSSISVFNVSIDEYFPEVVCCYNHTVDLSDVFIDFFGSYRKQDAVAGRFRVGDYRPVRHLPYCIDEYGILEHIRLNYGNAFMTVTTIADGSYMFDLQEVSCTPYYVISKANRSAKFEVTVSEDRVTWNDCDETTRGRYVRVTSTPPVDHKSIEIFGELYFDCEKPCEKTRRVCRLEANPYNGILRHDSSVVVRVGEYVLPYRLNDMFSDASILTAGNCMKVVNIDFGEASYFNAEYFAVEWNEPLNGAAIPCVIQCSNDALNWNSVDAEITDAIVIRGSSSASCRYHRLIVTQETNTFIRRFEVFGRFSHKSNMPPIPVPDFDLSSILAIENDRGLDLLATIPFYVGMDAFSFSFCRNPVSVDHKSSIDNVRVRAHTILVIEFKNAKCKAKSLKLSFLNKMIPTSDYEIMPSCVDEWCEKVCVLFHKDVWYTDVQLYGSYQRIEKPQTKEVVGYIPVSLYNDKWDGILTLLDKKLDGEILDISPLCMKVENMFVDADGPVEVTAYVADQVKTVAAVPRSKNFIVSSKTQDWTSKIKVTGNVNKLELFGVVVQNTTNGRLIRDPSQGLMKLIGNQNLSIWSSCTTGRFPLEFLLSAPWRSYIVVVRGDKPFAKISTKEKLLVEGICLDIPQTKQSNLTVTLHQGDRAVEVFAGTDLSGCVIHQLEHPVAHVTDITISSSNGEPIFLTGMELYGEIESRDAIPEQMMVTSLATNRVKLLAEFPYEEETSVGILSRAKHMCTVVSQNSTADDIWSVLGESSARAVDLGSFNVKLDNDMVIELSGIYANIPEDSVVKLMCIQNYKFIDITEIRGPQCGYIPISSVVLINELKMICTGPISGLELFGNVYKRRASGKVARPIMESGFTNIPIEGFLNSGILASVARNATKLLSNKIVTVTDSTKSCLVRKAKRNKNRWNFAAHSPDIVFDFSPHQVLLSDVFVCVGNKEMKTRSQVTVSAFALGSEQIIASITVDSAHNEWHRISCGNIIIQKIRIAATSMDPIAFHSLEMFGKLIIFQGGEEDSQEECDDTEADYLAVSKTKERHKRRAPELVKMIKKMLEEHDDLSVASFADQYLQAITDIVFSLKEPWNEDLVVLSEFRDRIVSTMGNNKGRIGIREIAGDKLFKKKATRTIDSLSHEEFQGFVQIMTVMRDDETRETMLGIRARIYGVDQEGLLQAVRRRMEREHEPLMEREHEILMEHRFAMRRRYWGAVDPSDDDGSLLMQL